MHFGCLLVSGVFLFFFRKGCSSFRVGLGCCGPLVLLISLVGLLSLFGSFGATCCPVIPVIPFLLCSGRRLLLLLCFLFSLILVGVFGILFSFCGGLLFSFGLSLDPVFHLFWSVLVRLCVLLCLLSRSLSSCVFCVSVAIGLGAFISVCLCCFPGALGLTCSGSSGCLPLSWFAFFVLGSVSLFRGWRRLAHSVLCSMVLSFWVLFLCLGGPSLISSTLSLGGWSMAGPSPLTGMPRSCHFLVLATWLSATCATSDVSFSAPVFSPQLSWMPWVQEPLTGLPRLVYVTSFLPYLPRQMGGFSALPGLLATVIGAFGSLAKCVTVCLYLVGFPVQHIHCQCIWAFEFGFPLSR